MLFAGILESRSKWWNRGYIFRYLVDPIVIGAPHIQRTGRIPDVAVPTARYPFEVTIRRFDNRL
jgi:hypothetical protein